VIDAYVTEVLTAIPPAGARSRADMFLRGYERTFRDRVPLPEQAYANITFSSPWAYAELGGAVEAWGAGPCRTSAGSWTVRRSHAGGTPRSTAGRAHAPRR
jgi:hypothetical protein